MRNGYETIIGLEIHAELCTESKIFCNCKNQFGAPANSLCCPVCTGMPGSLPQLNQTAVEYTVLLGHALHCNINSESIFERKHYFYPDLPKSYQISQLSKPICQDGYLEILLNRKKRRIGISRIQLEEDAGKLIHSQETGETFVDYNRCGVPLVEIVSLPDLRSASEAKYFMEGIAAILLYLGISDVKMQEGSLRADVNVSIRPMGSTQYGVRTEMKNINSFSAVYRAIEAEINRQVCLLVQGKQVDPETRRWDDLKGTSNLLRSKQKNDNYRFYPEPDLPVLRLDPTGIEKLKTRLPELPLEKALRYIEDYGLAEQEALLMASNRKYGDFFEKTVETGSCSPRNVSKWMLGELLRILNEHKILLEKTKLTPEGLGKMLAMVEQGKISHTAGKTVLEQLMEQDVEPGLLVQQLGLSQNSSDSFLLMIIEKTIVNNPKAVADYQMGKQNVVGYLVGQCMKQSKGQANPALLKDLLEKRLQANQ